MTVEIRRAIRDRTDPVPAAGGITAPRTAPAWARPPQRRHLHPTPAAFPTSVLDFSSSVAR